MYLGEIFKTSRGQVGVGEEIGGQREEKVMSQCLRCSKPCAPTSVFCEECRSLLRNQLQQESVSHGVNSPEEPLAVASSLPEYAPGNDEKGQQESSQEPITGPQPVIPNPQTPYPPSLSSY